jgi:hypothetical protein
MANTKKLTLSIDEKVLERARRYSRRHRTSISQLVSNYLAQLSDAPEDLPLSPAVRRLAGILPSGTTVDEHQASLEVEVPNASRYACARSWWARSSLDAPRRARR